MDEPGIRYLLNATQVDITRVSYSGGKNTVRWMNIRCPFAPWRHHGGHDNNPSFGITIKENGRSVYKCWSCSSKGRLSQLPAQLGHLRKRDYSKQRHWAELAEVQATSSRPLPNWEEADPLKETNQNAEYSGPEHVSDAGYFRALGNTYLRDRGINWQTVLLCDLRYDAWQHRILFPCYDGNESFVGFTGRSTRKGNTTTKGSDPKVKDYYGLPKREIFLRLPRLQRTRNSRHGVDSTKTQRIIVEGLFDYARLVGFGYRNTHAILGTSFTEEKINILVKDGDPIHFLMDNDLAGWQALFGTYDEAGKHETTQAWAYQLYREIPVWIVPYPTVFNGTDPGTLSEELLQKMLSKAWLFTGKPPTTIERLRDGTAVVTRNWLPKI